MRLGKLLTASAIVLSMSAAPVLAQSARPNPATKLSVASAKQVRGSSKLKDKSELAPAVIIGVLATAAIIGGAIALANNDDDPDSP